MTSDPKRDDRHRSQERDRTRLTGLLGIPFSRASYPLAVTVPLGELARAWLAVGTQSVGGATSTVYLMRSRIVERTGWLSPREFMETYALAFLSPGIHLVALAALIGQQLAGPRGLLISVAGMMVPAAIITIALSAVVGAAGDHPVMRAAFAGVAPVTAGMTIGFALVTARSTVRRGRRGIVDVLVMGVAFGLLVRFPTSTVLVILACALLGSLLLARERPDTGGTD